MKFNLLFLLAVISCTQMPNRNIAGTQSELAQEVIPPTEEAATKEILELIKRGYAGYTHQDIKPAAPRIIHNKDHGCVLAGFKILPNVPKKLQHGVFSFPGKIFPAWVRLSNGSGQDNHDARPDGRGLAIKLMGVEGKKLFDEKLTQDFLLQSAPNFFAADVASYVKFMKMATKPGLQGVGELAKDTHLRNSADRESLAILAKSAGNIANPLTAEYFSALPQLLGPHAMKLHAGPCANSPRLDAGVVARLKRNFLREIMTDHLSKNSACIELSVQLQTDPELMPIENAMVIWDKKLSSFIPVAQINIPKQGFLSPKRKAFCENISYNPWHSVAEHRPLGGLNRVRKVVYEQSLEERHKMNQQPPSEPNPNEKVD